MSERRPTQNVQRESLIEGGPGFWPSIIELPQHLTLSALSYGVTAWLFAVTGPFLIYVTAAQQGNLSEVEFNTWIFGGYFICGALSVPLTLYYRQPLLAVITIPGGVLAGVALTHLSFSEVTGAYLLTGILVTALGLSGLVKRAMAWLPMPISMAMVAGVLLPFGMGMVRAVNDAPALSLLTFAGFLAVSLARSVAERFPPVLGAIAVGLFAATALGDADWTHMRFQIAEPVLVGPAFTLAAAAELVIPLALTVIAVQNAQGIGILQNTGYQPPVNAITIASGIGSFGIGSLLVAPFGSQSTSIAGPMTGIVTNPMVGKKEGRYAAAIVTAVLWMVFGLFSPMATALSRMLPPSLVSLLAGLALLEVLWSCFHAAFRQKFRMGALFTFMITVSGIRVFNIGAPFWGLAGGTVISLLLEPADFRELVRSEEKSALDGKL
ncbi:MAG: benzoate/H(+) symporter BenE family transporter [Deltaproteobacteria bacterium]|nr:benzoate/H(+) symporter BenE family transporter [Deltaproteobacteria bacterium]